MLRITDPENRFTKELESNTDQNEREILALFKTSKVDYRVEKLLGEPSTWYQLARDASSTPGVSLLLDISAMPKRVFLFLVKQLLSSPNVQDLLVCYARPEGYKEGPLTEDAEPPAALPGFARVTETDGGATLIVGVGYTAFNLGELLQQARGNDLKFLFPFPPGSPAFRRNWRLLHELVPNIPIKTEIQRVHAMDMFAALDWITTVGKQATGTVDLIPLGPKPHALAMALAHRKIGDTAEILYSQPHTYSPDYSHGIAKTRDGRSHILAYCLRREGKDYF
ncbi:hypothetical protein [Sulfuricella denitrificans]|uniref:hypothetical protein n=1 Tax=Sulfuricella denitrificans TaxID=649841 RepID=UPI0011D1F197|nr:hypothetical protein [Sulfuricella denitrificans]